VLRVEVIGICFALRYGRGTITWAARSAGSGARFGLIPEFYEPPPYWEIDLNQK
jgi:hypothetical protein